jgi:hypothetical protein
MKPLASQAELIRPTLNLCYPTGNFCDFAHVKVCNIAQKYSEPWTIISPIMDEANVLFSSWLVLRAQHQPLSPVGECAVVTPDSILDWNHYIGIKIVFAEHSCFEPDKELACFHYSRGSVTPVTDLELALH